MVPSLEDTTFASNQKMTRYQTSLCFSRYHQETGRGGRDGEEATCVLFYTYADAMKARHMMQTSAQEKNTAPEVVQANTDALNAMVSALLHSMTTALERCGWLSCQCMHADWLEYRLAS